MAMTEKELLDLAVQANKIKINSELMSTEELTELVQRNPCYIKKIKEVEKRLDKSLISSILRDLSLVSNNYNVEDMFIAKMDISHEFLKELCDEHRVSPRTVLKKTNDIRFAFLVAEDIGIYFEEAFDKELYTTERIEQFLEEDGTKNQRGCLRSYLAKINEWSFKTYPVNADILLSAIKKNALLSLRVMAEGDLNEKEIYYMILDENPELITKSKYIRASDLKKAIELNIPFTVKEVGKVRNELDRETKLLLILNYGIPTSMFMNKEGKIE